MTSTVRIIADSTAPNGHRLTTMALWYPRFIHSEFMTHRQFSRNASSSRAIPISRVIEDILEYPAMPIYWGKNIPGMKAVEQIAHPEQAKLRWIDAMHSAIASARKLAELGVHKQTVNRLLEPFSFISVVVSSTGWDNFFEQRDHDDAQPEIRALARVMRIALRDSKPKRLSNGDWHLPYITGEDKDEYDVDVLKKVSAARCARVSYVGHDGKATTIEEDLTLFDKLSGSSPKHLSPLEHQATPWCYPHSTVTCGNFTGWVQHRHLVT